MMQDYYAVYRIRSNTDVKRMPNLRRERSYGENSMFKQTVTKFKGRKEDYLFEKYINPGNGRRLILKKELKVQEVKMNLLLGVYTYNQD